MLDKSPIGTEMMSFLGRAIVIVFLLPLSACVMHPTPQLAACRAVCVEHLNYCNHHCSQSCRRCARMSHESAKKMHRNYRHQQAVVGKGSYRLLKSYQDPLKCAKVSCNCTMDFLICNQGCTGVIQKRLRASPGCPLCAS